LVFFTPGRTRKRFACSTTYCRVSRAFQLRSRLRPGRSDILA
jgi:hypothetical protein